MASAIKRELSLDTNVLMDRGREDPLIRTFFQQSISADAMLRVPPAVLAELHVLRRQGNWDEQQTAQLVLANFQAWHLHPFSILPGGEVKVAAFARHLLSERILPPGEFNDGRILGQTSLAGLPVLATRDDDLLDADTEALQVAFFAAGLPNVAIVHPKDLLLALRRL